MHEKIRYTDLLIRISKYREDIDAYPVEATIDGDSFFYGGTLALAQQALLSQTLDNLNYGRILRQALFSPPIERAYQRALGKLSDFRRHHMRLRLQIDQGAPELHEIRWERLYQAVAKNQTPLAASAYTPFSRFSGLEQALSKPLRVRPLKMLIAIANPKNLPPGMQAVDVEAELKTLSARLTGLQHEQQFQITLQAGHSGLSKTLSRQLRAEGFKLVEQPTSIKSILPALLEQHIFHFIGHGVFRSNGDADTGTAALYMETAAGSLDIVKDSDFLTQLSGADHLPYLMLFSACESASPMHPAVGLAAKLVNAGVPAVVAMQDRVPVQLAGELFGHFYDGLLEHGVVDQALNDARLLLFDRRSIDWSIPVLFMRLQDGCLFTPDPLYSMLQNMVARQRQQKAPTQPLIDLRVSPIKVHSNARAAEKMQPAKQTGVETEIALQQIFQSHDNKRPALLALLGGDGTGRTTEMRRIVVSGAERSLLSDERSMLIPVYADLHNYAQTRSRFAGKMVSFLTDCLREFWAQLEIADFLSWLDKKNGPLFFFLFDGSDDLPEGQRLKVWQQIEAFANQYPRHRYLLACDPSRYSLDCLPVSDFLVIKALSRTQIVHYLKALDEPAGKALLGALEKAKLYDLASLPWLLIQMLEQTRRGSPPQSRGTVLRRLVNDGLSRIATEQGMQARAAVTLYALAWEIQQSRQTALAVDKAIDIMNRVRANREYSLEGLLHELVDKNLVVRIGQDSIRFAYPAIQAYCAAKAILVMPERATVLDDITATLGRYSRLRWWEDTLVLLSGMLDDVNPLLQLIVYGGSFGASEKIFLAARCVQESAASKVIDQTLSDLISDALVWRSRAVNEPRVAVRIRAIQTLGELPVEAAIPHLAELVAEKTRSNWQGKLAYEYSSVRHAALVALKQMQKPAQRYVHQHYPELDRPIACWFKEDVKALGRYLEDGDPLTQTIAAFALGNIGSRKAAQLLLKAFHRPNACTTLRWALTDTFTQIDPLMVTEQAILPFLDQSAAEKVALPEQTWKKRQHWYERVAYLIGRIQPNEPRAHRFLNDCLHKYSSVWLKARAIQALGSIGDNSYQALLQQIATGDFTQVKISANLQADEDMYLRCIAIEALGGIGDKQTLAFLRKHTKRWNPELESAYYRTSEAIYWKLSNV